MKLIKADCDIGQERGSFIVFLEIENTRDIVDTAVGKIFGRHLGGQGSPHRILANARNPLPALQPLPEIFEKSLPESCGIFVFRKEQVVAFLNTFAKLAYAFQFGTIAIGGMTSGITKIDKDIVGTALTDQLSSNTQVLLRTSF